MNARSTLGLVVSLGIAFAALISCGAERAGTSAFEAEAQGGAPDCIDSCGCPGAGGCAACAVSADCPRSSDPCINSRCIDAACEMEMITDGTRIPELQTDGDCRAVVCAAGQVTSRPDVDDPEDDHNDCTRDYCDGTGGMHHVNMPDGMACHHEKGLCKTGVCRRRDGAPCFDSGDCASGFCAQGVCCESTCKGTCFACDQPGQAGACLPVPKGSRHPGCAGLLVCVAPKDGCSSLAANGSPCNAAWDCASESCSGGICGQSDGTACAADSDCCSGTCQSNVCTGGGAVCDGEAATN